MLYLFEVKIKNYVYELKLMGNYNISMNKINVLQAGFHN